MKEQRLRERGRSQRRGKTASDERKIEIREQRTSPQAQEGRGHHTRCSQPRLLKRGK